MRKRGKFERYRVGFVETCSGEECDGGDDGVGAEEGGERNPAT